MQIRQYIRVAFKCSAELSGDEVLGEGVIVNLAIGGFAVESDQPVKPGMTLKLRMFLPDDETPIVIQQASIIWVRKGKFGLKTIHIGNEDQKRLNQFIVDTVNKPSYKTRRSVRPSAS